MANQNPLEITSGTLVGCNDLIMEQILGLLDVEDLKLCRLVNTQWFNLCQKNLKKNSVIKLEFDCAEEQPYTPKRFIEKFPNAPLTNTFSGVRILFKCRHDSFVWARNYPPLRFHPYSPLMSFLCRYGSQLSYFEIEVEEGVYMTYQLFSMKNILVDFMPNIAHLCVLIKSTSPSARCLGPIIPTVNSFPLAENVVLDKLTTIEWRCIPRFPKILERFPQLYISALADVIAHAPYVTSITTEGSNFILDVFKTINKDRMSLLKEIMIDPTDSYHSLDPILKHLSNLGKQNLQLESFAVDMGNNVYENEFWTSIYLSLSEFVFSQKDCLKKLKMRIRQIRPDETPRNVPMFLKMAKLEHLEISYTDENALEAFFGGFHHWTEFFPALKSFNITWESQYVRDDRDNVWSALLTNPTATHNNLQEIKVFTKTLTFYLTSDKCNELYVSLRQQFPNLKILEIYNQSGKLVYRYKTSAEALPRKTKPVRI